MTTKTCKLCGAPITGKKKYCADCKKKLKREYNKNLYNKNDDYRARKIEQAKKHQSKKDKIGMHFNYSQHAQSDFAKEAKVVANMKKKAFRGKNNKSSQKQNDDYNKAAYERYHHSIRYEEQVEESLRTCDCCGGTEFSRVRGEIVCDTCGLCYPIFRMSAYPSKPIANDDFFKALAKSVKEDKE